MYRSHMLELVVQPSPLASAIKKNKRHYLGGACFPRVMRGWWHPRANCTRWSQARDGLPQVRSALHTFDCGPAS